MKYATINYEDRPSFDVAVIDGDGMTYSIPFGLQDKDGTLEEDAEQQLKERIDFHIDNIAEQTKAPAYIIVIEGEGNFRHDMQADYKDRPDSKRPVLYEEARQYLIEAHQAEVAEGIETDDGVCIICNELEQCGMLPILVGVDKDLDQMPGYRYRPKFFRGDKEYGGELYYVDTVQAKINLYKQALVGDTTDNIEGLHRVGEKTAEKILKGATEEEEMYRRVLEAYKAQGKTEEDLTKTISLVYLLREEPTDKGYKL